LEIEGGSCEELGIESGDTVEYLFWFSNLFF
jgi:hypothetical protein